MKYAWIADQSASYCAAQLCRVMQVSRCGYQQWRVRPQSQRAGANQEIVVHLRTLHNEYHQTYGRRRLRYALLAQGIQAGEQRIRRLMQQHHLIAHARRRWRPRGCAGAPGGLTNQIQNQSTTENNQVWVSDMTYLRTQQGWLYLATVMDIHTRQIIGWAMAQRMNTALIEQALLLAIKQRRPQKEVIVHSDQGSQYMSQAYQALLKRLGCIPSVSKRGYCYDNATMESFFHSLKVECLYRHPVLPIEQTRSLIFRYIETFYNPIRCHSSLNYLSPNAFDRLNQKFHLGGR